MQPSCRRQTDSQRGEWDHEFTLVSADTVVGIAQSAPGAEAAAENPKAAEFGEAVSIDSVVNLDASTLGGRLFRFRQRVKGDRKRA